jgi:carbon storage regulator
MLVLTRKPGQEIVVGDNIRLTVLEIRGRQIRLGIAAPADVSIVRMELLEKTEGVGSAATDPSRRT